MTEIKLDDDGKKGRFTLYVDSTEAGELTFTWAGSDKFIIDHTLTKEEFGGRGYARQLVHKAVDYAREKGVKILPLCPYAKNVIERDPELHDVLN